MAISSNRRKRDSGVTEDEIRKRYPEFSRLLIQRKNEILGRKDSARANLDEQVMTSPGDEGDISVIDTSADYFLKLANTHQRELMEIDAAFDRMSRGVYGICESCEEPISIARLQHKPDARLCIDCQTAAESLRNTSYPGEKPTL